VKTPFRFMWCGDKGAGPRVDTAIASYIPWRQMYAQIPFTLPAQTQGLDLEVVGEHDWAILVDADTVLTHKALKGPWQKGAGGDILPAVAKGKAKAKRPQGDLRYLRVIAANPRPESGFGIWIRLRIRYKLAGSGPVYPWNQEIPSAETLKRLREVPLEIPNFTGSRP
jgi:hypothetical protein